MAKVTEKVPMQVPFEVLSNQQVKMLSLAKTLKVPEYKIDL